MVAAVEKVPAPKSKTGKHGHAVKRQHGFFAGNARIAVLPAATGVELGAFLKANVAAGSHLLTDGFAAYRGRELTGIGAFVLHHRRVRQILADGGICRRPFLGHREFRGGGLRQHRLHRWIWRRSHVHRRRYQQYARPKAALAAAKARGVKLGGPVENLKNTELGRRKAAVARQAKAASRTADLLPIVEAIRAEGITRPAGHVASAVETKAMGARVIAAMG